MDYSLSSYLSINLCICLIIYISIAFPMDNSIGRKMKVVARDAFVVRKANSFSRQKGIPG